MKNQHPVFEMKGYILAVATFLFTLVLFFSYTQELMWCLIASLINAGIVWGSYLIMRLCYLASK
jgi:hypothetical protein